MIDNRTPNLNLALPHVTNTLEEDVERLRGTISVLDTAVFGKASAADVAGKADLVAGKVPASQLPSFVDDVLEVANMAALPTVGESGKIYITVDTGQQYRWTGTVYSELTPSPGTTDAVPEGAVNLYFTDMRARAAQQPATGSVLGAIKVGSGLTVGVDGTLSATGGGDPGLPAFNELALVPTSNGQTTFTPSGGYIAGTIDVFLNGVLLYGNGDDYTASNGITIVLTVGINTTDTILLRRWTTATTVDFSALSGKPTSLAGYGIADGAPKASPTFTGPISLNGPVRSNVGAVAALDINCSAANYFTKTIAANSVITFSGAPAAPIVYGMVVEVTLTAGSVTWPAGVIWPNGVVPPTSTGKTHLFLFLTRDGGTTWHANAIPNYAS